MNMTRYGPEKMESVTYAHIYLIVERTEAVSPRYWWEQFYDHLYEMSSEAMQSAYAGLHCQASTCVSRGDRARRLES